MTNKGSELAKAILGSHKWNRGYTPQQSASISTERYTVYVCQYCSLVFKHRYNVVPDIFLARQKEKINEECYNAPRIWVVELHSSKDDDDDDDNNKGKDDTNDIEEIEDIPEEESGDSDSGSDNSE